MPGLRSRWVGRLPLLVLLALLAGVCAALIGAPAPDSARAQSPTAQSVPSDWPLIPDGVKPGQSFRLLFVTSTTRDASSSEIADYNAHVQAAAANNSNLAGFSGRFRALISTSAVDARDNTATTGTGVSVHWLGGAKVADDYADLYDKSWDSVGGRTETGSSYGGLVWTGGNKAGVKSGQRYAGAAEVRLGDLTNAGLALSSPNAGASSETYPLYALSPVITVAQPVKAERATAIDDANTPIKPAPRQFQASTQNDTEVWTATLTVGLHVNPRGNQGAGFCASQGDCFSEATGKAYGSLTDTDFTLDGTDYEVESIRWGTKSGSGLGGNVHLTLDRDFPDDDLSDLKLQVGSHTLNLSDASKGNSDGDGTGGDGISNNYRWSKPMGWTNPASGTTVTVKILKAQTTATQKPAMPTGLSATAGNQQVTLSWTNPDDASISGYQYRQKAGTANWGAWTDVPGSGRRTVEHLVTGLVNGTEYRFRLRAVNSLGNSPPSDAAGPVTPLASIRTCLEPLPADGSVSAASYLSTCKPSPGNDGSESSAKAQYYWFTLEQRSEATISVTGGPSGDNTSDVVLCLLNGHGHTGSLAVDSCEDENSSDSNSERTKETISVTLAAGDYTIEVAGFEGADPGFTNLTAQFVVDNRPTVVAESTGYYSDAALTKAITGPQKAGADIYTKVTFSADMKHVKGDTTAARPLLAYVIAGTGRYYEIVNAGDALTSGSCRPNHATRTNVYVCRYTVEASYNGTFVLRAYEQSQDKADNALRAYRHTTSLTLDTTVPGIAFPTGVTPTVGTAATITLTDSGSKIAKYGVVEVAGTASDATGCDDPSASGDNFTTTAVSPAASSHDAMHTPVAAGKKICVYAEDVAGNSKAQLWNTPINVANAAATGKPSMSGTAKVGQTLTAAKGTIADTNGITKATAEDAGFAWTYQWIRVDSDGSSNPTDITGATESTYELVEADQGKKVKVKVSFKDDDGYAESRTSDAYPSGSNTIAQRAQSSDADLSGLTASSSTDNTNFSALTLTPSTFNAATTAYTATVANNVGHVKLTPTVADGNATVKVGKAGSLRAVTSGSASTAIALTVGDNAIKVEVTAEDGTKKTYTVTVTRRPANSAATGKPSITGTATVGQTLTAATSDIVDSNGLTKAAAGNAGFAWTYQWIRVDSDGSSNAANISGATSSTYVLTADDEGKKVKVKVSFKDDEGYAESRTSDAYPTSENIAGADGAVWSATLTVDVDDDDASYLGCDNTKAGTDNCSIRTVLSVDSFSHGGSTYTVARVAWDSDLSELYLGFTGVSGTAAKTALGSLTLHVDDDAFAISDAKTETHNVYWPNVSNLNWSDGDKVSLSLIPADTTAPTVASESTGYHSDAALTSVLTGPLKDEANIYTKVTFSEDMKHVKSDGAAARPELFHRIGETDTQYDILNAGDTLESGDCKPNHATKTDVYVCFYTVGGSDNGAFALKAGTNSVDKAGNALASAYTHATTLTLDNAGPTIPAAPAITSDPGDDDTYKTGDKITVAVTFNEPVTVGGTPSLNLTIGGGTKRADYESGSGTDTLTFAYTVKAGEEDTDGIAIAADAFLRGLRTTVRDALGHDAVLTLPVLAAQAGHKVDGVAPAAPSAVALASGTTSPGTDSTPSIDVTVPEAGGTVTLYLDPLCQSNFPASDATDVTDTDAPYTVTVTANALPREFDYKFYARYHDKADNPSPCSTAHAAYSYTPPNVAPVLELGSVPGGTAKSKSVTVTVTDSNDDDTLSAEYKLLSGATCDAAAYGTEAGTAINLTDTPDTEDGNKKTGSVALASDTANGKYLCVKAGDGTATVYGGSAQIAGIDSTAPGIAFGTLTANTATSTGVTLTDSVGLKRYGLLAVDGTATNAEACDTWSEVNVASALARGDISGTSYSPSFTAPAAGKKVCVYVEDTAGNTHSDTAAINGAATGTPAIGGTAKVGETLTAATGGIADVNGVTKATAEAAGFAWTYQWIRVDSDGSSNPTNISGATSSTYVLTATEVGKKVKVKVSFKDDEGYAESRTSDAYPTGSDTIAALSSDADLSGLTASSSTDNTNFSALTLDQTFAAATTSYTASVANNVTQVKLTPTVSDDNATVKVGKAGSLATVSSGSASAAIALTVGDNAITVEVTAEDTTTTKTYTVTVKRRAVNSAATGKPSISGTATVGETLTAAKGNIADTNGLTKADNDDTGYAYTYQWIRVDSDGSSNATNISGATSKTYELTADDEGKKVKVKVSFKDDEGYDESRTSDAYPSSGTIAAADPTIMPPANAIWSATLTVDKGEDGTGCDNDVDVQLERCSNRSVLTDDGFAYRGANYQVTAIDWYGNELTVLFGALVGTDVKRALGSLALTVDGTALAVSDAKTTDNGLRWTYDPDTDWADGQKVQLWLAPVPDDTAPTVTAASTGYFSDAALSNALTGPQKAGADIYTKVTFSEDMKHVKSDAAAARPELFRRIGTAETQYHMLDNADTLASGDCKPNHATNTNVYVCLYTVGGSDSGAFGVKAGTASVDKADNALADDYIHTETLTLDTTAPSAPSAVALAAGTTSPGNDDTPSVEVTVAETGGKVTLYSDSSCSTAASAATEVTDSDEPYKVTVPATALASDGSVTFYARHEDAATNASACSTANASYVYDGTAPGIAFPSDVTPRVGTESTITLTDATAKVAKYAVLEVDGMETDASGCNDPRAGADNFTTTAVDPAVASKDVAYTPVAAGKKICVYAEDAVGNSHSDLWSTQIGAAQSSDADLSGLTASSSTDNMTFDALTLDQTFDADTTSYTATVANNVTHVKLTPTVADSNATVKVGKMGSLATVASGSASAAIALTVGDNAIKVEVTAEDATKKTYTVTVTRRPANSAASGKPTISGTAKVGQTLTAATSGIADTNGVTKATAGDTGFAWTYQWIRVDSDGSSNAADISGATSKTYVLTATDAGKKVKVKVSFKDDAGYAESRTSDAYPAGSDTIAALSSDADLSALTASSSTDGSTFTSLTLTPSTFDADTTAYTATVANNVTHVKLTPTVSHSSATVKVGKTGSLATVTSGSASAAIALVDGANAILVEVTAQDGTTKTYTVTVTRQAADTTGPTISTIAVTSSVPSNQNSHYKIGDAIKVTATFNEALTLVGSPTLKINVGGTEKSATCAKKGATGDDAKKLVCSYTVADGDEDTDGIAVAAGKLSGTIKDGSDNAATLTYTAITTQSAHKVDGVRPTVSSLALAGDGQFYGVDDDIVVQVTFSEGIGWIPLKSTLGIKVGSATRKATFDISSGLTEIASFAYTVVSGDSDTDGVSIDSGNIALPAGENITDLAGNAAVTPVAHGSLEPEAESAHKVDTEAPTISFPTTEARAGGTATLTLGDSAAGVKKYGAVVVAGTETDAAGCDTAAEIGAAGLTTLTKLAAEQSFEYTLPTDSVGKKVCAYAEDAAGNSRGKLWATTVAAASMDDTTGPTVVPKSGIAVTSSAGADGFYKAGETIKVTLTFNEGLAVTGVPTLTIKVGSADKTANCAVDGSDAKKLVCSYVVADGDTDTDGIAVEANKLVPGSAMIKDASNNDATLTHQALAAQSGHKVDTTAPTVTDVSITSSAGSDGIYADGDDIEVTVTFSETVKITGTPSLRIRIGTAHRGTACAVKSDDATKMVCTYTAGSAGADVDGDGIALEQNQIVLTPSKKIRDLAGNDADRDYAAVAAQSAHKVDTAAPGIAFPASPAVPRLSTASTITLTDSIAKIKKYGAIVVDGTSGAATDCDTAAKITAANLTTLTTPDDSVDFPYTPPSGSLGKKICVYAEDVAGNSGSDLWSTPIAAALSSDADLSGLTASSSTDNMTFSALTLTPSTFDADTTAYTATVANNVTHVKLTPTVSDTGATVKVGKAGSLAAVTSGSASGAIVLVDGANEIKVEVTAEDGTKKTYTVTVTRQAADTTGPTISTIAVTSSVPSGQAAYKIGDAIKVTATFNEDIVVTGTPKLEITVGSSAKSADCARKGASGAAKKQLECTYTVIAGDADTDGISVAADKLTLPTTPAASIKDGSNNDATRTYTAITAQGAHKVDGVKPTISTIAITSTPPASPGGWYKSGNVIKVTATFSEALTVAGSPTLKIDVGGTEKSATCAKKGTTGDDAKKLVCSYTVAAEDEDTDGIAVAAGKLAGTIKDGSANAATLTYTAIAASSGHKVDAKKPGIAFPSSPAKPQLNTASTITLSDSGARIKKYGAIVVDGSTGTAANCDTEGEITSGGGTVSTETTPLATKSYAYTPPSGSLGKKICVYAEDAAGNSKSDLWSETIQAAPVKPKVTLTLTPTTINESGSGNSAKIKATLPSAPSAAVVITLTLNPASGVATANGTTLTIPSTGTESNEVTITAVDNDVDAADAMVTITGATTSALVTAPDAVTLTVSDDDTAGVTITPTDVSVNEGSTATYTVKLDTEPTANVVITPTSGDTGAVTVSTSAANNKLTFTTSNWSQAQTVTVTGVEDSDADDESVTVSHSATGGGYASVSIDDVTVAVDDDDAPAKPTGLSATAGDAQVALSWDDPSDSSITKYQYQKKAGSAAWETSWTDIPTSAAGETNATSYTVTSLSNGTAYRFRIRAVNANGSSPQSDATTAVTPQAPDTTGPTISTIAVTSTVPTGQAAYKIGDDIKVTATFNEDIVVVGTPKLEITVGSAAKSADCARKGSSGAAKKQLECTYTVATGDADANGISVAANKLTLPTNPAATIKDGSNNAATRTHNAITDQSAHKVDGVKPTISTIAVTSTVPTGQDAYKIGDDIKVTATFNEDIVVTGAPKLEITVGTDAKSADCARKGNSGAAKKQLECTYTVVDGDEDTDGIVVAAGKLSGTIKDGSANAATLTYTAITTQSAHEVDGVKPTISTIAVTSSLLAGKTAYGIDDWIRVTATFTEDIEVTGTPKLEIMVGMATKSADCEREHDAGAAKKRLVCRYQVQAGDADANGISVGANKITLPSGASITDGSNNDATRTHSAIAASSNHKVEAVRPTVTAGSTGYYTSTALSNALTGTQVAGANIYTKVTFSEDMYHVKSTGSASRPVIYYFIDNNQTRYHIINNGDPLTSGKCKPNHATNTNVYVCLYTVKASDNGPFKVEVRTGSVDKAHNALANTYTHATTLMLRGTVSDRPAPPTGLTATAGDGQVALNWDDPNDDSITKYQVAYRPFMQSTGGTWQDIPDSGPREENRTSHTVTGLQNGTKYRFLVRAVGNRNGIASSADAKPVPRGVTSVPARPRINHVDVGNGKIVVYVFNPNDPTIEKYQVATAPPGTEIWRDIPGSSAGSTILTVRGLKNGTAYTYRIRAVNAKGPSDGSLIKSATPQFPKGSGGKTVAGVDLWRFTVKESANQLKLRWRDRFPGAWTGYIVEWKESSDDYWQRHYYLSWSGHYPSFTINNLKSGTLYNVRVYLRPSSGDRDLRLVFTGSGTPD